MNADEVIRRVATSDADDLYAPGEWFARGEVEVDGELFEVIVNKRQYPRNHGPFGPTNSDLEVAIYVTHPQFSAPVSLACTDGISDVLQITIPDGRVIDLMLKPAFDAGDPVASEV